MKTRFISFAAVICGMGAGLAGTALAQNEVADFYRGKTITMLVGSGPGGGYDTYARLMARHMGKYIPGNPNLISQNKVGAASIVATNFLVNVAPKDGTVIGSLQRQIALLQLMGKKGLKFDADKLNWLGSLAKESGVCALATRTGVTSFDAVFQKEFSMGSTGATASEQWPALFNSLMAAKFKLIKGYPSTPQIHLAIRRGELDGICQSWASFSEQAASMLKDGSIKPMVQMTFHPDKEMTKRGLPMLEDFLTRDNLAKGQNLEDVRLFFELTLLPGIMGRPFAVAPEVPKARVAALRTAFMATTRDPAFIKDAAKLGREIEVLDGDAIQDLIGKIAKTPKHKLVALNKHITFRGKVEKVVLKLVRHTGKIVDIKRKGRQLLLDHNGEKVKASVSGRRTKVTVDGKKAKRGAVKSGMTCTFVYYGSGTRAEEVNCES